MAKQEFELIQPISRFHVINQGLIASHCNITRQTPVDGTTLSIFLKS